MSIGQQLLDVPFGEMVSSLGMAIAQAQCALDSNSIEILKMMGEADTVELPMVTMSYKGSGSNNRDNNYGIEIVDTPYKTSMIGAGFQPTFYQFAALSTVPLSTASSRLAASFPSTPVPLLKHP